MDQLPLFSCPKTAGRISGENTPILPVRPLVVPPGIDSGLVYLRSLIENGEPLIFMVGSNSHVRFVRSHSSQEGRVADHLYSVMYAEAKAVLEGGGYRFNNRHIYGERIGAKGDHLAADVWRPR